MYICEKRIVFRCENCSEEFRGVASWDIPKGVKYEFDSLNAAIEHIEWTGKHLNNKHTIEAFVPEQEL